MIGNKLKFLRQTKGWTQKDVWTSLGISDVRYSNYENDKRQPDYDMLKDIANLYNVSIDYLVGYKSSKNNDLDYLNMEVLYNFLLDIGFVDSIDEISDDLIKSLSNFIVINKDYIRKFRQEKIHS